MMKRQHPNEDWRSVGTWKTGVILVCLLGFPFADYVVRYTIAHLWG